jgi:hypothetical protein
MENTSSYLTVHNSASRFHLHPYLLHDTADSPACIASYVIISESVHYVIVFTRYSQQSTSSIVVQYYSHKRQIGLV